MSLIQKSLSKIITSSIILVLGILFIIANQSSKSGDYANIATFLGVVAIIVSIISLSLELLLSVLKRKRLFTPEAVSSASILAIGIFFVADKLDAILIISFLLEFIPYLFIVLGFLVLVDGLLALARASKAQILKQALPLLICEFVLAAIVIIIGAISLGDNTAVARNKFLVFGIILVIYSSIALLLLFLAPTILIKIAGEELENESKINKAEAIDEVNDDEIN